MRPNSKNVTNLLVYLAVHQIRQNRIARDLEIDEAVFSRVINGYREPTAELKTKLSGYLGVDPRWLFAEFEWVEPPMKKVGVA